MIQRKGDWLQVQDYESDRGWVSRALNRRTPYHVLKSNIVNIRSGAGARAQGRSARLEAIQAKREERMASSTDMSIGSAQLRGTNTV